MLRDIDQGLDTYGILLTFCLLPSFINEFPTIDFEMDNIGVDY